MSFRILICDLVSYANLMMMSGSSIDRLPEYTIS